MEMFRWILIIAGVAILALLYFSGRPKRPVDQREALDTGLRASSHPDALADPYPQADNYQKLAGSQDYYGQNSDPLFAEPVVGTDQFEDLASLDPDDFVRPGTGDLRPGALEADNAQRSSIAQKIESFSNRLSPKRSQRVADAGQSRTAELAGKRQSEGLSKIVSVHVVAPQDQVFNGPTLYELFEQRGFHFGEMNIFHSMHQQKKVFSIAKMVEPGYFDIEDINTFYTPGITLILQLPGPVAADVAFEVLISEARGLAQHLGGIVLGSDRSTLSNQAVSHMREDILEYMHRQRFFASAKTYS
jgi:cell division protein ZipA